MRKWVARILGLGLLAGVGLAAANATTLRACYAARQLRSATTDDVRSQQVKSLLDLGDAGFGQLIDTLRTGDAATCAAVGGELRTHFSTQPNDGRATTLLAAAPTFADDGREAVLGLLPELLKSADAGVRDGCRAVVEQGLKASPRAKTLAVTLAPRLKLAAAAVPLLSDADAGVRAAAMGAVGAAGDAAGVADEELFRWLNDPDANVRHVCGAVLETRGRTADEIDLGRRLTHPHSRVRLQLLDDLAADAGRDVGPWLERLGHDPEPAVRAGAVRVASERKLLYADWADRLAAADPDAIVRQVATFHRRKAAGLVRPAGYVP